MTIESTPTRRLQADWPVDVLGVLTIAVYGSWYYGFGVLIEDIGVGLDVGSAPLGLAFGLAQILLGALSLITGRILDRFGPQLLLGVIGPVGAILVGFSGRAVEVWQFVILFGVGGGISAAAGFYGMTQAPSGEHLHLRSRSRPQSCFEGRLGGGLQSRCPLGSHAVCFCSLPVSYAGFRVVSNLSDRLPGYKRSRLQLDQLLSAGTRWVCSARIWRCQRCWCFSFP